MNRYLIWLVCNSNASAASFVSVMQAYELLRMPFYALYYYRRAASLRPSDARMWCALGQCYAADPVSGSSTRSWQQCLQAIVLVCAVSLNFLQGDMAACHSF
jgi:hypothetical protein